MPVIDHLLASARLRQFLWKLWYPYLTRKLRADDVVFLNYAFEEMSPAPLALDQSDEPNRASIQLYHHVASPADLRGKKILEISCGHGGGASFLARTCRPAAYTGLDLNPSGIAFCRQRHRHVEGLNFVQGDAQNLPFADATFDVVVNVEASHCYPSFPRFLQEVSRVLRPGGDFAYTDFRFRSQWTEWENAISSTPFQMRQAREINAEVLRGMDRNSGRSLALILRHLPAFMHGLGRDFAGVKGSRVYTAIQDRVASYRSWHFEKPMAV
ncbi:MAG: phthiotriol/phenolphthiotriol dimycocerosates methyltransferase [Opitutaceae bacterium]